MSRPGGAAAPAPAPSSIAMRWSTPLPSTDRPPDAWNKSKLVTWNCLSAGKPCAELRRVLNYPEVIAISANMTPERIGAFLQRLCFCATLIRRLQHTLDFPRDPADEPYIDLAITAAADYLVPRDKDLLSLRTDHSALGRQFRRLAPALQVVSPDSFMDAVSGF